LQTVSDTFEIVAKGKFNFIYEPIQRQMSDTWYDDIILVGNSRTIPINTVGNQFMLNSLTVDSVHDLVTGKNAFVNRGRSKPEYFLNELFVQKEGKWLLSSLYDPSSYSGSIGFDSIHYQAPDFFKGYLDKKFGYYPLNKTAQATPEYEVEYPGESSAIHLVCRNCTYETKKCKEGLVTEMYNDWGDIEHKTTYETAEIPVIKKGEMNIVNADYQLVLNKWAEDILIPAPDNNSLLSLSDTGSAVYHQEKLQLTNVWPDLMNVKTSIALKYGGVWQLIIVDSQNEMIDGFEEIKLKDGYWETKKNGKVHF